MGSPTKIDCRKKGTLILSMEDLVSNAELFPGPIRGN